MFPEELYLKKKLLAFYQDLDYVNAIVPPDTVSRKRLKMFIETR